VQLSGATSTPLRRPNCVGATRLRDVHAIGERQVTLTRSYPVRGASRFRGP